MWVKNNIEPISAPVVQRYVGCGVDAERLVSTVTLKRVFIRITITSEEDDDNSNIKIS
jgi:hypothetical protein